MKKISMIIFGIALLVAYSFFGSWCLVKSGALAKESAGTEVMVGNAKFTTQSEAMAMVEVNSGRVLASHNENTQLPMASLTKIITAIVAIENCADLDEKHEIPKVAQGIEGSSIYLKAGEHLSIRELLYGLMLRSGNDSAVAIASIIGGDIENFAKMCNEFCTKVGATSTNLVNPHGLHESAHHTTALDLAKISAYALKNQTFAEVVRTEKIRIPQELGKYDHRDLINKNRFLKMLEGANGIKTGYTKKAGRCFVGSATRESDGMQVVCVLLNCNPMFQECKALTELAQQEFAMKEIIPKNGYETAINIKNSEQLSGVAKTSKGFVYPLTKTEEDKIEIVCDIKKMYDAPIKPEEILGEVKVFLNKELIFSDNICNINSIEDNSYGGNMAKIIENF